MSWGNPMPAGWRDDFRAMQKPDVRPVDELSAFVYARILATELEPRSEVPQVYNQPVGPMAHRYAAAVRRDMVAFRRILAEYCDWVVEEEAAKQHDAWDLWAAHRDGLLGSVTVLANRWADHPDFRDGWRLE